MSLTVFPIKAEARRTRKREQYWPKLVSNIITNNENNKISFDLNDCSQYLTWQRKPFYEISTLDFYMYTLSCISAKLLAQKNNKDIKKNKNPQISALVGFEIKLYSLNASHPNYAIVEMNKNKRQILQSRIFSFCNIFLYNKNKDNLRLLSHLKTKAITIDAKRSKSLTKARILKKKIIIKKSSINSFKFCSSSMIGDCNQKCVFLSNLKFNKNEIYSNGLICLQNGFDSHPWGAGTGDHINSNHVLESCKQFIYLLIRNCFNPQLIQIISKKYDNSLKILTKYSQCHLTIFNANIKYIKFIELGEYKIELIDLSMISSEDIKKSCIAGENILFAFRIEVNLKQNANVCVNAQFCVCPIFLISTL